MGILILQKLLACMVLSLAWWSPRPLLITQACASHTTDRRTPRRLFEFDCAVSNGLVLIGPFSDNLSPLTSLSFGRDIMIFLSFGLELPCIWSFCMWETRRPSAVCTEYSRTDRVFFQQEKEY